MDVEAYLHIVLDAYHGDVVSLIGRVDVQTGAPLDGAESAPADGLVTVRVAAGEAVPRPPDGDAWLVRLVGPGGALDARSSDGTLKSLRWDAGGLTATLDPGDAAGVLGIGSKSGRAHVMHVLVLPEPREG